MKFVYPVMLFTVRMKILMYKYIYLYIYINIFPKSACHILCIHILCIQTSRIESVFYAK